MNNLDMVGSFIVGGLVLLSVIMFTFNFNNVSNATINNEIQQRTSTDFGQVIEYDFNKIGYRVPSNPIVLFDSTRISFLADLDNNGTADSVNYFVSFDNRGMKLNRRVGSGDNSGFSMPVAGFMLEAYDSLGTVTASTAAIKSLRVDVLLSQTVRGGGGNEQSGMYWTRRFYPLNL